MIKRIFYWIPILILSILMIDAIFFSPLYRWSWGFWNYEMLSVFGFLALYMIFVTYWNTIKMRRSQE